MKEDTARSIVQIKTGISVRNWEEQIRACQESGQTVKEWCGENGIPLGLTTLVCGGFQSDLTRSSRPVLTPDG